MKRKACNIPIWHHQTPTQVANWIIDSCSTRREIHAAIIKAIEQERLNKAVTATFNAIRAAAK